jgi:polysaccharide pyruvyl transferase WcaK-like protein
MVGADVLDGFYSLEQLRTFVLLARIAKAHHREVTVLGFSHNGNEDPEVTNCLKELSVYARLNVRDEVSLERMRKLGIPNLHLTADMAFLFDEKDYPLTPQTEKAVHRLKNKKMVAVNVTFTKGNEANDTRLMDSLADALMPVCATHTILLIPHDLRDGHEVIGDLLGLGLLRERLKAHGFIVEFADWISTAIEAKSLLKPCEFVVTNRMHLAIAAITLGKVPISLSYQGKFEGLYDLAGLSRDLIVQRAAPDAEALKSAVVRVMTERVLLSAALSARMPELARLAGENMK